VSIAVVIVGESDEIVVSGRSRLAGKATGNTNRIAGNPLAYAEVNALLALDYDTEDTHSLRLNTTVEPCPLCISAICMAGVKREFFAACDAFSGSENLLQANPYRSWVFPD
jgi:tRNA(adenine34) deaminase